MMKKTYSKPQIVFESFELSQSIAGDCTLTSNHIQETCPVTIEEGFTLFSVVPLCSTTPGPGLGDRICYDVPSLEGRVFSS